MPHASNHDCRLRLHMRTVAVAGGSLGGLRTAEALRSAGWTESVIVIGSEASMPYTRPPLSKKILSDDGAFDNVRLRPRLADDDVDWRLGISVTKADLAERRLHLSDGQVVEFDALVAATGVTPRTLPISGPHAGRHTLRTLDDARAVHRELRPGRRVVVIGAGFIGCEVAAAARAKGCEVDVVCADEVAMLRPLGRAVGHAIQRRHTAAGIRFHPGRTVQCYEGIDRVSGVVLDDGFYLSADVVVEAVGSAPNVTWLDGNGLDTSDGVMCDSWLRLGGVAATAAVGDVARFPNTLFDTVPRRFEHWQMAVDTARQAARTIIHDLSEAPIAALPAFEPLPSFWSDQGTVRVDSFGSPGIADCCEVLEGQLSGECAVGYYRAGRPVGVVLIGMPRRSGHYRTWIGEQLYALSAASVAG
ncbi:NAD(P)/FAD-dependent oxidoreductase [Nocardia sp. NPDC051990]|uniref:NAD(P)/FAD-dependent oxidoreductase n=1 Tax=Nocardia sp. NPDC051990 TaxID=3155285 RepID=UPI003419C081